MEQFPREDLIASQEDDALQRAHPWQSEPLDQRNWMCELRDETIRKGASQNTHWIYFSSPEWTWQNECGREGWLLIDYLTLEQHDFVLRVMS
ncbi:MAG: hypothetical protein J0H66_00165 [Solirubrobacterales bacterium]|nr:hypothetical protein [Solirubrobacterales bacterium]OJU94417.1 MAG: hypothetical protein BGO23_03160 [Solirubrobacterales bacterium 67-14]